MVGSDTATTCDIVSVMHPELANLQQSYNKIVDDVQSGNLPYEQALATLAGMSTPDADGWLWSIDPQTGGFVRARPGGSPEPADTNYFVPAQLPPRQSPFAAPDLSRPPTPAPAPPTPWGPTTSGPTSWDPAPATDHPASPYPTAPPGPYSTPPQSNKPSLFSRIPGLSNQNGQQLTPAKPKPWLRPAILAAVVVLVLALVVTNRHGGSPTTTTLGSTLPQATSTTSTVVRSPIGRVPTSQQLSTALNAITSGSPGHVHQYVLDVIGVRHLYYYTSLYAGFVATGYSISSTGATPVRHHHAATSVITVFDPQTHVVIVRSTVTWVVSGGIWKWSTWPSLQFIGH